MQRSVIVEAKARKLVGADLIDSILGKFQDLSAIEPHARYLLAISGHLTSHAREIVNRRSLVVWDANELANRTTPELATRYFSDSVELHHPVTVQQDLARAAAYRESLTSIEDGQAGWVQYQQLCSEILEYLFCPPLQPPRIEHSDADKRNRRDMVFENTAADGFWGQARSVYEAFYIVVDAKNYGSNIKKRSVLELAHYLKAYGCGQFGILVSRKGAGPSAMHAIREQWIGSKKMIVSLSDQDLFEMLEIKARGGIPEELVRRKIGDFRMSL